jgi:L-fuculose-phosphate aldolase
MSAARELARLEVIHYCSRMQAEHLVYSTAGNISCRVEGEPDVVAMTPTGYSYERLEPNDICIVSTDGEVLEGHRKPTSELPLHTVVYARRPEVGAIIHTHSPSAMTMAVLGWDLPPILTGLVEAVGGDVRCAPYSKPTTVEMVDLTADALTGRGACFMRHHGLLAVGATLAHAFQAASVTEGACRVYLDARAQGVDVPQLGPDDIAFIAAWWQEQWEDAPVSTTP